MKKIIISGGGTGGHIYPALAIADALKEKYQNIDIVFVGATGKMEMQIVPKYGYTILSLPIRGLQRGKISRNLDVPLRLFISLFKAFSILYRQKPNIVIGTGGYASLPLLLVAQWLGIKTCIQEQNSYPGWTNRLLAKRAHKIFIAYPHMEKYFSSHKIAFLGNPIRQNINLNLITKEEALEYFELVPGKFCLFIMGGSLGAKSINTVIIKYIHQILKHNIQVLWQTGKLYYNKIINRVIPHKYLKIKPFINEMHYAYKVADLVVGRGGALSIAELSLAGKACLLIPSPNVAEDHQTKNILSLKNKGAAYMIPDKDLNKLLVPTILKLFQNPIELQQLTENIKTFAKPNAAKDLADLIFEFIKYNKAILKREK